ncbi:RNA-binding protein Raly [Salmo salar]|uniref:RNA-binding protein Raly n=1 Tax=Salmo salar TaxID=8030 RepID=A0ABM3DSI0_SALSA|nr:RNA-binding protein Raly-like [Salmo salar]
MVQHVFQIHGLPVNMVSDRGPQFSSWFWMAFCTLIGLLASLSSGFQPQSNCQSERANLNLEITLCCLVSANPTTWSQLLISTWRESPCPTDPEDINMAGEPKPNRPKGLKRSAAGLYSGYHFDNDYYRDEFYDRLFEYRSRVSPVPRIVPVKWPHMAMPLVHQVKYLPSKLLARSSLLPSSPKQKSVKSNELQVIKSELTQIKFNIDALLGRLEQITEDKHFAAELQKAEESNSEVSQDESCSDTEKLVDETHNSDVEDGEESGTPDECEDDDMDLHERV